MYRWVWVWQLAQIECPSVIHTGIHTAVHVTCTKVSSELHVQSFFFFTVFTSRLTAEKFSHFVAVYIELVCFVAGWSRLILCIQVVSQCHRCALLSFCSYLELSASRAFDDGLLKTEYPSVVHIGIHTVCCVTVTEAQRSGLVDHNLYYCAKTNFIAMIYGAFGLLQEYIILIYSCLL